MIQFVGLALLAATTCAGQSQEPLYWPPAAHEVVIKWTEHGEEKPCRDFSGTVTAVGVPFQLSRTDHGVLLSPELEAKVDLLKMKQGTVKAEFDCDGVRVEFPSIDATWISRGGWDISRDYPPYSGDEAAASPRHGTWTTSFGYEPLDGDGPQQLQEYSAPFSGLVDKVAHEPEPDSVSDRISLEHAKAFLHINYDHNRYLLLARFQTCLEAKSANQSDCDSSLGAFLINLYWRGDDGLLQPLMSAAADKLEVLQEMGYFYGELLSKKPDAALMGLRNLSITKRDVVCRQAGEDYFSMIPAQEGIDTKKSLQQHGGIGERCWRIAREAAKHPYGH